MCSSDLMMKTKNFIKPQYNNSINTQHCGRLPEKTNFDHAGSVIFVTKIKTRTRIIGRRFQRTRTRIIVIEKTKTI